MASLNDNDGDLVIRFLAEEKTSKDSDVHIDYSVLSVVVLTLALLMIVEVLRHKLDHMVHHKPVYKAVLEGVTSELASLGIVEFFLHIIETYHKNYDKAKKHVFADVHFMLFYTALLNALGSLLLNFFTSRLSQKLWVQTETLNYMEIRVAFNQVNQQLDMVRPRQTQGTPHATPEEAETGLHSRRSFLVDDKAAPDDPSHNISYRALKSKYNELLLQLRFHELCVHCLQAYDLPSNFKVSNYLIRSKQAVLLKLIHVDLTAWLFLTGFVNLLYYILGLVSLLVEDARVVSSEDANSVDTVALVIFFCFMAIFVLLSWAVSVKMKSVLQTITHSDTLWNVHTPSWEREKLWQQQQSLFWGEDPKLMIAAIQAMQFGYALAIAAVIEFWQEINVKGWYLILAIAICYALFVKVTVQAIPRYTLCTSLGQLVDEHLLHETVADFLLSEAKKRDLDEETPDRKPEDHDHGSISGNSSIYGDDEFEKKPQKHMWHLLYTYFISDRYVAISHVFGTMFALFFVGQRVENFLPTDSDITRFDFAPQYIFRLLFMWLSFFLIGSLLAIFSVTKVGNMEVVRERKVVLAAEVDCLLSIVCLMLLIIAEENRCCTIFGARKDGGFGTIEPFTVLIVLRVFRFWAAKRLIWLFDFLGWNTVMFRVKQPGTTPSEKVSSHNHRHGQHGHVEEKGTAAELWRDAVAKNPEIVERHGAFSIEILHAMLGLPQQKDQQTTKKQRKSIKLV